MIKNNGIITIRKEGKEEMKISRKKEEKKEREKQRKEKETKREIENVKKNTTTQTENSMLPNNALGDIDASHIVPLDPRQTYIFRDFLQTNNIINESMKVLQDQTKSLMKGYEEAKAEQKQDKMNQAAYEVRYSAHAIAAMVQAKVSYIKTLGKK